MFRYTLGIAASYSSICFIVAYCYNATFPGFAKFRGLKSEVRVYNALAEMMLLSI